MFSRFFINRPIFAAVLSIVITLAGAISLSTLPVAQFPRITPPTVTVSAQYPGASARDVAEAVAAPIEEKINGVEGMMYMSSQCTNDGGYNLTVTFHQGVDLDMAQVLVQNRVSLALPSLPDVIKATGVATRKRSPDIVMGIALTSPGGRYDQLYLSNYALRLVRDELSRIEGVSDVFLFGQRDFSMRVWVDPAKLAYRSMTAGDVVQAIREQNTQIASGMIGQPPTENGQQMQFTVDVLGRLSAVEQFENIIIKTVGQTFLSATNSTDGGVGRPAPSASAANPPDRNVRPTTGEVRPATGEGSRVVRLKDVARVELGAKSQDVDTVLDGKPTVFLAIFQLPDANALATRDLVVAKMDELRKSFPEDVAYEIGFDTTPYTRESIREVYFTFLHAIILVALVVLVFLQNWRSSIIPLIAVPVAIIGTFTVMAAFGFSLNNLTLFGLVLAIGIVVDDAIVVVEAVEHHIERGLAPREATIKAMEQVSGPVVAVGLVLSAVFVPCAFISGITGMFFRQFALTIAVSTIISAFNSLTLSPALCALLLRPVDKVQAPPLPRWIFLALGAGAAYLGLAPWIEHGASALAGIGAADIDPAAVSNAAIVLAVIVGGVAGWIVGKPLNRVLSYLFRKFHAGFEHATNGYTRAVGKVLRLSGVALVLYGGLLVLTYFGFRMTAKGFIPNQDMGYLMGIVQLPDSASMERTQEVMRQLDEIARRHPGVRHATVISGQSFALQANGSNFGSMFVNLKDYAARRTPELSADAILNHLRMEFSKIHDAQVQIFGPPPVRGVGRAGGFAFVLEDRGDLGPVALQEMSEQLSRLGSQQPGLIALFTVFRANVPQLEIEPDLRECLSKGVSPIDFADTLRVYQGSLYVNDFNLLGRTWQVIVQADASFRNRVESLSQLKTRNNKGAMVPLGSVASVREVNGPLILNRYNMYPAATINGMSAPGVSSRQAIDIMQRLATQELPPAMAYEWTDMSYLELQAGESAMLIFFYAVMMVFLVLAAQYESWSLPLAVILVVPLCLLGAIAGVRIAGMEINIFTQVGFVVLVGLSSKNAILIVEFAKLQREAGVPREQATLEACRLRLRPIVMTSLAFVLGVVPLILSHGAGFEMRRMLGTAVFGGMIGVTLFGIILTPVFFYVINRFSEAPWLNSPVMRRVREVTLGVLAFGYVRKLGELAWKRGRR